MIVLASASAKAPTKRGRKHIAPIAPPVSVDSPASAGWTRATRPRHRTTMIFRLLYARRSSENMRCYSNSASTRSESRTIPTRGPRFHDRISRRALQREWNSSRHSLHRVDNTSHRTNDSRCENRPMSVLWSFQTSTVLRTRLRAGRGLHRDCSHTHRIGNESWPQPSAVRDHPGTGNSGSLHISWIKVRKRCQQCMT